MATIKSYTDLEQSRKLAEILPLESADMHYVLIDTDENKYSAGLEKYIGILPHYPCWSLAALLCVLPYPFLSELSNEMWKCGCYPNGICYYVAADSPIDACVELILKLNELKRL